MRCVFVVAIFFKERVFLLVFWLYLLSEVDIPLTPVCDSKRTITETYRDSVVVNLYRVIYVDESCNMIEEYVTSTHSFFALLQLPTYWWFPSVQQITSFLDTALTYHQPTNCLFSSYVALHFKALSITNMDCIYARRKYLLPRP